MLYHKVILLVCLLCAESKRFMQEQISWISFRLSVSTEADFIRHKNRRKITAYHECLALEVTYKVWYVCKGLQPLVTLVNIQQHSIYTQEMRASKALLQSSPLLLKRTKEVRKTHRFQVLDLDCVGGVGAASADCEAGAQSTFINGFD